MPFSKPIWDNTSNYNIKTGKNILVGTKNMDI